MTTKTVLFDLDGTLLDYDMVQDFLPHYFRALTSWMAPHVPPERFVSALQAGTEAITQNVGLRTNAEVFAETFYALAERPRHMLEPHFEAFYRKAFPQLRVLARPRPAARRILKTAFSLGFKVVIATNPYFPVIATMERLRWADVADFPYEHITTYENSHAVKPARRYYQDILDVVNCEPKEALMVGDEAMDMAAGALGCLTYLVRSPATSPDAVLPPPDFEGDLAGVEKALAQLAFNGSDAVMAGIYGFSQD